MKIKSFFAAIFATVVLSASAFAQTYVVVTPTNPQGWTTADTRPGGSVDFVVDSTAPRGGQALRLITDATTTAKAQYMHEANIQLDAVTDLSYHTKQVSALFPLGDASYQLPVCLGGLTATGACIGFTTFVFEPYQNPAQGPVVNGVWQDWDVDAGLFWSSRSYTDGACTVVAGAGGPPLYTLAGLNAACPNAVVVGFGVNIGSNNPGYEILVDLVRFNDTIYDFQLFATPTRTSDCKGGGYQTLRKHDGSPFRNQGECVSYVNQNGGGDDRSAGEPLLQ